MKEIVFILGSTDGQRCFKRIEEFRQAGYKVCAYGFDRGLKIPISHKENCKIIGCFPNSMPYVKRIEIIKSSLKKLFDDYKSNNNVIWYYFGEIIALFSVFLNKNRNFIYEESDISTIKYSILTLLKKQLLNYVIKKSSLTVFTSEGFIKYHFGKLQNKPDNVIIKPNKVNPKILHFRDSKKKTNIDCLKFGFVGCIRFNSVYSIADVITSSYPNAEFHFYGVFDSEDEKKKYGELSNRPNIYFHGPFKNPHDLPAIYSNIDIVISTYDALNIGVLYAEPNKLYEAIYFRTPIIVSKRTFLSEKVEKLDIGYSVDSANKEDIINTVEYIVISIYDKISSITKISQSYAIDNCDDLLRIVDRIEG